MLIGYVRVLTNNDQNLDLQYSALKEAGCEKIFEDKISGSRSDRPGFNTMMQTLCTGDTFVICKLERLGKNLKALIDFSKSLENRGINFKSLSDKIDTTTPDGKSFFYLMESLYQMDKAMVIERTKAGLFAAKKEGRVGGRKRKMTDLKMESAKRLLASGKPPKEVADNLEISVPTLYRWLPASMAG